MSKITLRDIYWDEYGVGGIALGDLMRHTILTIEQILKEGNSLSDIDLELPSSHPKTQNE